MKSIVKSEATLPMAAVQDQRYSPSPAVKSEFSAQPRPPTAAFSCEYCGKEFNLKQYLIGHVVEIHGDTCIPVKPEPYPIQSVSSESTTHSLHEKRSDSSINADITESNSSMSLPQSLESNSVEKLRNTNITRECFTGKKVQNGHMIVDTDEKQFTCEVCQKKYRHKRSLNTHLRIHPGVNLYSCEVCKKSFSQKVGLSRHMFFHSGEKPYSCEVCKKNFSLKGGLNKHMLTHNGGKPYTCEVCQKNFRAKGTLN
eukprot:204356_1